jgi:hypothetical protein
MKTFLPFVALCALVGCVTSPTDSQKITVPVLEPVFSAIMPRQLEAVSLRSVTRPPNTNRPPSITRTNPIVLTLTGKKAYTWQDTTDLKNWNDITTSSNLTLNCTAPIYFVRARTADRTVEWNAVSNALGYCLYVGTNANQYIARLDVKNVLKTNLDGFAPYPTTYIRATTYVADGESDFSEEVTRVKDAETPEYSYTHD